MSAVRDDSGSLLLLAGFILGISLIVTGLTLSEVAELEKESVREQDTAFTNEYRSVREKLGTALGDTVTATTSPDAFRANFQDVMRNFDELENSRGYQLVGLLSRGDCTAPGAPTGVSECLSLTAADATCGGASGGRKYAKTGDPYLDGVAPNARQCYDGTDDGALVSLATGSIRGAYVYLHLSDPIAQVEEAHVFPLNEP